MASVGSGKQLAKYPLAADITNSATTLTVGTLVEGTAVDDDALPLVAVLEDGTSNSEQVLVTGISTTTWTIIRAYNSTTGVAHSKDAAIQVIDTEADQQKRAGSGDLFFLNAWFAGGTSTGQKAGTTVVVPVDAMLRTVSGFLSTANAGSTFIFDTEKDGTDCGPIVTIADGATVATTAKAVADIAVTAGSRLRIEVDQVGSGTAGSDLAITWGLERV